MKIISAFVTGLLFGLGLIVSGMADPGKVLGFLDLAGDWDPSLALVMAGAIAIGLPAFTLWRRPRSWLGLPLQIPASRTIDRRLIGGSLMFGVGWGLAGICPGPSIVLLGAGSAAAVKFVLAMLAGMALFEWLERRRPQATAPGATPAGGAR